MANKKDRAQNESARELLVALREIVRYAILTLAAVRDPDARYLSWSHMPANVVRDVREAYGYSSAWVREFAPTAGDISQMEVVMPWLAWLRREEGETALRRIIGWSMGVSLWRLGQREGCSDKTILNRIDRSMAQIALRFADAHVKVEVVEELAAVPKLVNVRHGRAVGSRHAIVFEKPSGPHGEARLMKVYLGAEKCFWRGKRWRDGRERIERMKLSA